VRYKPNPPESAALTMGGGKILTETSDGGEQAFDSGYANRTLVLLSVVAGLIIYVDIMLTPALPKIVSEYGVSIDEASR